MWGRWFELVSSVQPSLFARLSSLSSRAVDLLRSSFPSPGTSLTITLLPTYSSSLFITCTLHFNLLSCTFLDISPTCLVPLIVSFLSLSSCMYVCILYSHKKHVQLTPPYMWKEQTTGKLPITISTSSLPPHPTSSLALSSLYMFWHRTLLLVLCTFPWHCVIVVANGSLHKQDGHWFLASTWDGLVARGLNKWRSFITIG